MQGVYLWIKRQRCSQRWRIPDGSTDQLWKYFFSKRSAVRFMKDLAKHTGLIIKNAFVV